MVSFVGHGLLTERGGLHLATRESGRDERHEYTAWSYDYLRQFVLDSPARVKIVILDCCFSGRAVGSLSDSEEIAELTEISGAFVLTSAGHNELALAPVGATNTAFLGALIRLLSNGDPAGPKNLTLNHVFRYLSRVLPAAGCPRPRRKSTGMAGDLILMRNPARQLSAETRAESSDHAMPSMDGLCPYPGLTSFTEADSAWFFGREKLTAELCRRVSACYDDASGPLLVIGASGSGKTSLLRAGLLPAVARGELNIQGAVGWQRLVLTPSNDPVTVLASRLAPLTAGSSHELATRLALSADEAAAVWQEAAGAADPHKTVPGHLLVVVDQFEEIFTECGDKSRRHAFIRALHAAGSAASVLLGMRADFLGRCADYPELARTLAHPIVIGPMTSTEVRAVIERPANVVELEMEPGLTDLLLRDLGSREDGGSYEAGRLPLLSHALRATWRQSESRLLTVASYIETGRIQGALAHTADRVLRQLDEPTRALARPFFLRLVHVSEGTEDTRRRVSREQLLAELPQAEDEVVKLIDCFAADDARLITVDNGVVEITHEALIYAWPSLRSWIDADRAGLLVQQELIEAARIWNADGRDSGSLYRGSRLALIVDWAGHAGRRDALGTLAQEFLDASVSLEAIEHAATLTRGRLRTAAIIGLTLLFIISIGLVILADNLRREANLQRDVAESSNVTAAASQLRQSDPLTAMRLTLAAYAISATAETRSALLGSLLQPELSVFTLATTNRAKFSGDGSTGAVVVGHNIQIWDLRARRLRRTLHVNQDVAETTLSHDGQLVGATFGDDSGANRSMVWNSRSGQIMAEPSGVIRLVASEKFGASIGKQAEETLIRLPDVTPVPGLPTQVQRIDTNAAGDLVALVNGRNVDVYKIGATATRIYRLRMKRDDGGPTEYGIRISSNKRWVMTTGQGARLLDLTGKVKARSLNWASGAVDSPGVVDGVFSQDGRVLVTSNGWAVQLWDTETMAELHRLTYPGFSINTVALMRDDAALHIGSHDATSRVVDVSSFTRPKSLLAHTGALGGPIRGALFSPDGRTVATVADSAVRLWDRSTGRQIGADIKGPWDVNWDTIQPPAVSVPAMSYSPDGQTLAIVRSNHVISLIDVSRMREKSRITVSERDEDMDEVMAIAFHPDGHTLAISDRDFHLRLWDIRRNSQTIVTTPFVVSTLVWTPDKRLALSHTTHTTIWDPSTASSELGEGSTMEASSEALAVSPNGRTLLVRGENDCSCGGQIGPTIDARVWLWDTETLKPINPPLSGHTGPTVAAAFSADGTMIATASKDRSVRIWDVKTHALIGVPITGYGSDVIAVSFSSDGRTLYTLEAAGNLKEIDITIEDAPAMVCVRADGGLTEQEWRNYIPATIAFRDTC
nr:AAA family ATPase [Herbidospora galbida]